MSVTTHEILDAFERKGLRNTRPRRAIAEKLAQISQQGSDFATEDLWRALQEQDRRLGRATVFRAVDTLLVEGLVDRVEFADGVRRGQVQRRALDRLDLAGPSTVLGLHRSKVVEELLWDRVFGGSGGYHTPRTPQPPRCLRGGCGA